MKTLTACILAALTGLTIAHIWIGHIEQRYWETR